MNTLTVRQHEVLTYCVKKWGDTLSFPSELEIAERFKTSRNAARHTLKMLAKLGYIEARPIYKARGLYIPQLAEQAAKLAAAYLASIPSPAGQ